MKSVELISGEGLFEGLKAKINIDLYYIASMYLASLQEDQQDLNFNLIQVMDSHLLATDDEINEMINKVRNILSTAGESGGSTVENNEGVVL